MSAKLDDPNLAPKTYWSIVSRFLNKKKYQLYHLLLVTVNSSLTFNKNQNILVLTLLLNVLLPKLLASYQSENMKEKSD